MDVVVLPCGNFHTLIYKISIFRIFIILIQLCKIYNSRDFSLLPFSNSCRTFSSMHYYFQQPSIVITLGEPLSLCPCHLLLSRTHDQKGIVSPLGSFISSIFPCLPDLYSSPCSQRKEVLNAQNRQWFDYNAIYILLEYLGLLVQKPTM
jgi:hypothetical protein